MPPTGQRLIALLALGRQPQRRAHVAGTLWPETAQRRSAANLRSTLWRLRALTLPIVESTAGHLALVGGLSIDIVAIEDRVRRLIDRASRCSDEDLSPMALAGDLLPDWDGDDWLLLERERLRQLCLHGLDAAGERLLELRRYGEAVEAAMAAVRGEPLRESPHRLLIAIHVAEGNRSEALRHYDWYRRLLHDELGIAPSSQMAALIDPLR